MMELVIKIPEEIYNHTQEYEVGGFSQENDAKLFIAIKNGTPLPKGQKGYWIKETIALPLSDSVKECVRCSKCGLHFDFGTNFCPNCGDDKRGTENDKR